MSNTSLLLPDASQHQLTEGSCTTQVEQFKLLVYHQRSAARPSELSAKQKLWLKVPEAD